MAAHVRTYSHGSRTLESRSVLVFGSSSWPPWSLEQSASAPEEEDVVEAM